MSSDIDELTVSKPSPFVPKRDAEPQVICNELLHRLIHEQGYKGEAGRLCRDEVINMQNITELKIEFHNILLIDHLWKLSNLQKLSLKCNKIDKIENLDMLINLRELDLSFNFIERIENLDCLVNLEFLSLFGNQVTKLENLEPLTNLVRLSLGNNQIETLENVRIFVGSVSLVVYDNEMTLQFKRLRFLPKLYVLNMEGNPVVGKFRRDVPFTTYVAAMLPKLKYYNYTLLTDEEREEGCKRFR